MQANNWVPNLAAVSWEMNNDVLTIMQIASAQKRNEKELIQDVSKPDDSIAKWKKQGKI